MIERTTICIVQMPSQDRFLAAQKALALRVLKNLKSSIFKLLPENFRICLKPLKTIFTWPQLLLSAFALLALCLRDQERFTNRRHFCRRRRQWRRRRRGRRRELCR